MVVKEEPPKYKRPRITFLILSRVMIERDRMGKRFPHGKVEWGKWEIWNRYKDNTENFKDAVRFVTRRLRVRHIGSNVYVSPVVNNRPSKKLTKLYQAKYGHDGVPFIQFEGIAGEFWRRKMQKAPVT